MTATPDTEHYRTWPSLQYVTWNITEHGTHRNILLGTLQSMAFTAICDLGHYKTWHYQLYVTLNITEHGTHGNMTWNITGAHRNTR
jgi:hypothetical protein